jgi:hypothetical protein
MSNQEGGFFVQYRIQTPGQEELTSDKEESFIKRKKPIGYEKNFTTTPNH